jgi:hypothetical protein
MDFVDKYSMKKLRDYSRLFSRGEVKKWSKCQFDGLYSKLEKYDEIEYYSGYSCLGVLRDIYKLLDKYYPNEYIYKNKLLNQWIRETIGADDSVIFNEFRLGKVIADMAMFNGVSRVFEIKTPLDKESRLNLQISEYKKIFNEIYVVIPKEFLYRYEKYDAGIITYNSELKEFKLFRKAARNTVMDVDILMEVFHTREYRAVVSEYYGELPAMDAFTQFSICKNLISKIPKDRLNSLFIKMMKCRKVNNSFYNKINSEFNQICLSMDFSKQEMNKIVYELKNYKI